MANLKEIRTRISSVSSTKQITSAMKMVSAAKLRKAQDTVTKFRPYADKLKEVLADLSSGQSSEIVYAQKRDINKVLIVVISSNKGLCGAFNANVAKKAIEVAESYKDKTIDFVTVGKKAGELIAYKGFKIKKSYDEVYDKLSFDSVIPIAEKIMQWFVEGDYDKIELVYNSFKNAASQNLKVETYLPIEPEQDNAKSGNMDYIYEPDKTEILEHIIPIALKTQVYKAIIDSFASEHGARMTAMHKATDNATDLLHNLTLTYNKARQAAITNEILEIVGGAEALKG